MNPINTVSMMVKKSAFILLCIYAQVACAHIPVRGRTVSIYRRYYLIKRLESACRLLHTITLQQNNSLESLDEQIYTVPEVMFVVQAVKTEKNMHAIDALWSDFSSYAQLYNPLFEKEFVDFIYILYHMLSEKQIVRAGTDIEESLTAIDCCVDKRSGLSPSYRLRETVSGLITIDGIAQRFYCLKRLQKSMTLLKEIYRDTVLSFMRKAAPRISYADMEKDLVFFHHERIRESITHMCRTESLEPLLQVCKETKQYRYTRDDVFLQEMLMQIYMVYKHLLLENGQDNQFIMDEMVHVLDIYDHLGSMSIDQALQAIDSVTEKLNAVREKQTASVTYMRLIGIAVTLLAGAGVYYVMA